MGPEQMCRNELGECNSRWIATVTATLGLLLAILPVIATAQPTLRQHSPDPEAPPRACHVYSRNSQYHEYSSPGYRINPDISELSDRRLVPRPLRLRLNQAQCERFLNPEIVLFSQKSESSYWYKRSEFIHESELVPIEHWETRYIYENSYPSMVGSELMLREEEIEYDLVNSYAHYALDNLHTPLLQFSDDAYFMHPHTGTLWRIMRHPYHPPTPDDEDAHLYAIDPSGRYLPQGVPIPSIGTYGYLCHQHDDGSYSCVYGIKPKHKKSFRPGYFGRVNEIVEEFDPLKVEPDRITITRRVSKGEPFRYAPTEFSFIGELAFHANFEDPVRPVYFARGLLLRDSKIVEQRPRPRASDFIQQEVCLTDCPSDVAWQFSGRRRFDESHP